MNELSDRLLASLPPPPPPERGIYCNRTLNLRTIGAIGYDMDYTLIHYNVQTWEQRAYDYLQQKLADRGWPVQDLCFDQDFVIRGLIIDRQLGNIVKANRFGYIKRALHGTRPLELDAQKRAYSRTVVELGEKRWAFLNTLFATSEGCMYAQLVDLLDARALPEVMGYTDLYHIVRTSLDETHKEGRLKAEIVSGPERFVELDRHAPLALLDQQRAGKRLMLITNSDWPYTRSMMAHAYDPFLPQNTTWRDLFEIVIVSAQKPQFFSLSSPIFEVVSEDGLLRPCPQGITKPGIYLGGHAALVEEYLGCDGSEILYVGDHIYGDVHQSKNIRRWRTALILRELEREVLAVKAFEDRQARLTELMESKTMVEYRYAQIRVLLSRKQAGQANGEGPTSRELQRALGSLRQEYQALDEAISPLAREAGEQFNRRWGLLMRAGNDKSYMARQLERHADIYTSRTSNFLYETPFVYFRSPRGSLPHDPAAMAVKGAEEEVDTTARASNHHLPPPSSAELLP